MTQPVLDCRAILGARSQGLPYDSSTRSGCACGRRVCSLRSAADCDALLPSPGHPLSARRVAPPCSVTMQYFTSGIPCLTMHVGAAHPRCPCMNATHMQAASCLTHTHGRWWPDLRPAFAARAWRVHACIDTRAGPSSAMSFVASSKRLLYDPHNARSSGASQSGCHRPHPEALLSMVSAVGLFRTSRRPCRASSRWFVGSVITGQTKVEQMDEYLDACELELGKETLQAVERIHMECRNPQWHD